ncbi:34338_t:CDS:2, partial [Gigaspora margarita]
INLLESFNSYLIDSKTTDDMNIDRSFMLDIELAKAYLNSYTQIAEFSLHCKRVQTNDDCK